MKNERRLMDLLNRYHLYLYALGYKIPAVDDNHNSITEYVNAVDKVAKLEGKTIEELANCIGTIFQEYDKGGSKSNMIPDNDDGRTLNGLKHFKEFISRCNKESKI